MRLSIITAGVAIAAGLAGCAAGASNSPTQVAKTSCAGVADVDADAAALYAPGSVQRVEAIYRQDAVMANRDSARELAGAAIYVPAQASVTEAYLERSLSCRASGQVAAHTSHPNDPLQVAGVDDVDVRAAGPNLRIAVTARDHAAGKSILERARALRAGHADIEVRQLTSAASARTAL